MLQVQGVSTYYGNLQILHDVSMEVKEGEVVTVIGANGAGKTTLLKTITGLAPPRLGQVVFQGRDISRRPANEIVGLGITLVTSDRDIFPEMTVYENLLMGYYPRRKDKDGLGPGLEQVYTLFPRLKERQQQLSRTMSGGERQMLVIGRALMSAPKLLLLDEPSMGLSPRLIAEIAQSIQHMRERGVTILLVEQNCGLALSLADRGYVLQTGQVTMNDKAANLMTDPTVKRMYLGG
ncbi:MAG: ABC transporter ATP-binding protein [Chloroflexi bacterium]|nr:ABC transporter ATP-binding protein [Chloroflexota bacterium]